MWTESKTVWIERKSSSRLRSTLRGCSEQSTILKQTKRENKTHTRYHIYMFKSGAPDTRDVKKEGYRTTVTKHETCLLLLYLPLPQYLGPYLMQGGGRPSHRRPGHQPQSFFQSPGLVYFVLHLSLLLFGLSYL